MAQRFALLIALLFGLGGGGVYLYERHALLEAFDSAHELAIITLLESIDTTGPLLTINEKAFLEEVDETRRTLAVVDVGVWDAEGRMLVHVGGELAKAGPERELVETFVIRRKTLGQLGTIAVSRRVDGIARELSVLARALLGIVLLGIAGTLGVAWVMAGQALRPVKEAYERQRAFMADASHELRTPLAVVRTQAEVALGGEESAKAESLRVIARTAKGMGALVDDLLFLSRADSFRAAPKRVGFALETMMEEAIEAFRPLAAAKGSELLATIPDTEVEVVGDPNQIQRLIGILLDNAIRHGKPGPIVVALAGTSSAIHLEVRDSGPGISEELLPRVFDRFTRGTDSSGHGLGLAIAKSIVEAHRGELELQSSPAGTTILVTLPTS